MARILFIGGTRRGYLTLKALLDHGANVTAVVSLEQDAHETERYEQPLRALAAEKGLVFFQTRRMKDRDYEQLVREELRPDLIIAVGARILFPPGVVAFPPLGCVGVHDSLLPEYRGFAPLNWAIINGEEHTGVTLFHLNEAMDQGDIVARRRVPIGPEETAPEVYDRVCAATTELVLEMLPMLEMGTAPRMPQPREGGTYTCSRTPTDGWIDWARPTRVIHNLIRALTQPYPGAFTAHEGRRLWVWKARPLDGAPAYVGRIPGRVIGISEAQGHVDVLTCDGVLRLSEVQLEGGERTAAAAVIRSVRVTLGLRPADVLKRLEELEARVRAPG